MAADASSLNHGIFFLFETALVFLGHVYPWFWIEVCYRALGSMAAVSCVGLHWLMHL